MLMVNVQEYLWYTGNFFKRFRKNNSKNLKKQMEYKSDKAIRSDTKSNNVNTYRVKSLRIQN